MNSQQINELFLIKRGLRIARDRNLNETVMRPITRFIGRGVPLALYCVGGLCDPSVPRAGIKGEHRGRVFSVHLGRMADGSEDRFMGQQGDTKIEFKTLDELAEFIHEGSVS